MVEGNGSGALGAYGFRLIYADQEEQLDLIDVGPEAPPVPVEWHTGEPGEPYEIVTPDRVGLGTPGSSGFEVRRDPPSIQFDFAQPPVPGSLVHPLLTIPISVLARWRGDVTLHAGAFEAGGAAWAMVGMREAGKSTTLASIGQRGHPVVADDLLTIAGTQVWAGPHCVDLRPDVAARFPEARRLGEIGGRVRHRLSTPPGAPTLPLGGLFLLDWHEGTSVAVEPLPRRELLRLLYAQEYIGLLGPADPVKILALLTRPAWRVVRPRDWDKTDELVDRILDVAQG
jgi:hypothetical protein